MVVAGKGRHSTAVSSLGVATSLLTCYANRRTDVCFEEIVEIDVALHDNSAHCSVTSGLRSDRVASSPPVDMLACWACWHLEVNSICLTQLLCSVQNQALQHTHSVGRLSSESCSFASPPLAPLLEIFSPLVLVPAPPPCCSAANDGIERC